MIPSYLIFFAIFFSLNNEIVHSMSCKDKNNKLVDFFIIKSASSEGYQYLDNNIRLSNKNSFDFEDVKDDITSQDSILSKIFKPVYENSDDYIYIQYNDSPPENSVLRPIIKDPKINYASAKGVLVMNKKNYFGIWFLHNVPEYLTPFKAGTYDFPRNLTVKTVLNGREVKTSREMKIDFGFWCINIKRNDFNAIKEYLTILNVKQYGKDQDGILGEDISKPIEKYFPKKYDLKTMDGNKFKIITEAIEINGKGTGKNFSSLNLDKFYLNTKVTFESYQKAFIFKNVNLKIKSQKIEN